MNINTYHQHSIFISNPQKDKILPIPRQQSRFTFTTHTKRSRLCFVRATEESGDQSKPEKRSFLSFEEAGLVEISGLGAHEKFLCRLTISSLNLLRVISEQEGCSMEELNAGKICDWFLKDKLKREHNIDSAVLQWEDPDFPF